MLTIVVLGAVVMPMAHMHSLYKLGSLSHDWKFLKRDNTHS